MNNQTRSFAKYASLSVIGMIGLSCYILADTFFVAQGLGTNGLAALNLAIPVYSVINGTGMMTGMGAATCYSIMRNRGDEKADKVFTNALFIAAFFTLVFEICGIFFSGSISRLLGAEGDTYEMCRVYLRTLLIFSPFSCSITFPYAFSETTMPLIAQWQECLQEAFQTSCWITSLSFRLKWECSAQSWQPALHPLSALG